MKYLVGNTLIKVENGQPIGVDHDSELYSRWLKYRAWSEEYDRKERWEKALKEKDARFANYPKYKQDFILALEKAHRKLEAEKENWLPFYFTNKKDEHKQRIDNKFSKIFKMYKTNVKNSSAQLAKKWKQFRIPPEDFESIFWEEIWQKVEYYSEGQFYLFEIIRNGMKLRTIDVHRRASRNKQEIFERTPVSYEIQCQEWREKGIPSTVSMEEAITNSMLINQLLSDPVLTREERDLLEIIYINPEASEQILADLMREKGYDYYQQKVGRRLKTIRKKLAEYAPR